MAPVRDRVNGATALIFLLGLFDNRDTLAFFFGGGSTVSHVLLDQVSVKVAEWELAEPLSQIRNNTGMPVELFAYPNGKYGPEVLTVLATSGIKAAVTTRRGFARPASPGASDSCGINGIPIDRQ